MDGQGVDAHRGMSPRPGFRMAPAFVLDFFSPAMGFPRLREIVVERKMTLLWSWLIVPSVVLSVLYIKYGPHGGFVTGSGLFLGYVVIPILLIVYYVVWLRGLIPHLKRGWGSLRGGGMRGVPLVAAVVLLPGWLIFAMLAYSINSVPLFQNTRIGVDWLLPLVAMVVAVVVASYPRVNAPFLVASLAPLVGFQGLAQLAKGRLAKGTLRIVVGWMIIASMVVLLRISWIDTYRWTQPHQLIKVAIYLLGIAYFAIWFMDMAELSPGTMEEGWTTDTVGDVVSS